MGFLRRYWGAAAIGCIAIGLVAFGLSGIRRLPPENAASTSSHYALMMSALRDAPDDAVIVFRNVVSDVPSDKDLVRVKRTCDREIVWLCKTDGSRQLGIWDSDTIPRIARSALRVVSSGDADHAELLRRFKVD